MAEEIELPQNMALVRPTGSTKDLVSAMAEYQDLCVSLLNEADWQEIKGRRFAKRSAWRKLAVAYGVSFTIVDRQIFWDDNGNLKAAEFVIRATAPNGRHADGWGACSVEERNAGRKATHDIPATAETRAKNRAAADLFGMGEVSAEEIDRNAMYISDDQQLKLRERINVLPRNQRTIFRGLWKDANLPKLEYLNDDQLEQVHTFLDNVESFDDLEESSPGNIEPAVDSF
jgi:hypothetical protein|tara:strand:- start:12552 stop:13241 length:690 start_codon:yes stop_codon:yes gene_type:complete